MADSAYQSFRDKVNQCCYVSSWPHFESLDSLIGGSFSSNTNLNAHSRILRRRVLPSSEPSSPPLEPVVHNPDKDLATSPLLMLPWFVPVGPRSKRAGPNSLIERNFSVMAAAAAAAALKPEKDEEEDDDWDTNERWGRHLAVVGRKRKGPSEDGETIICDGYSKLAEAIGSLVSVVTVPSDIRRRRPVPSVSASASPSTRFELFDDEVAPENGVRSINAEQARDRIATAS
ncbi:Unknown protein [Striga hermonthica]|uniref:Uncharacterized protein n=1 Tax=Striga hermonthica TaxID=68872 RepID=A0A9N7N443_STRHE|nr:Unknown protein [Striga hermonthica]